MSAVRFQVLHGCGWYPEQGHIEKLPFYGGFVDFNEPWVLYRSSELVVRSFMDDFTYGDELPDAQVVCHARLFLQVAFQLRFSGHHDLFRCVLDC